jgi:ubiquitin carboxyl-terminal hydrolase 25/28
MTVLAESELVKAKLERERTVASQQLDEVWKADRTAVYELTSVFIHRGTSLPWAHYFFYSRNLPKKPEQWFKYNECRFEGLECGVECR